MRFDVQPSETKQGQMVWNSETGLGFPWLEMPGSTIPPIARQGYVLKKNDPTGMGTNFMIPGEREDEILDPKEGLYASV